MAFDRCEERLWRGIQVQVEAEIDDDEALESGIVGLVAPEKAQEKSFTSEDSAFEAAPERIGKNWISPAQSEQITMHLVDFGMLLAFGEVEFALAECFFGFGIDQNGFAF